LFTTFASFSERSPPPSFPSDDPEGITRGHPCEHLPPPPPLFPGPSTKIRKGKNKPTGQLPRAVLPPPPSRGRKGRVKKGKRGLTFLAPRDQRETRGIEGLFPWWRPIRADRQRKRGGRPPFARHHFLPPSRVLRGRPDDRESQQFFRLDNSRTPSWPRWVNEYTWCFFFPPFSSHRVRRTKWYPCYAFSLPSPPFFVVPPLWLWDPVVQETATRLRPQTQTKEKKWKNRSMPVPSVPFFSVRRAEPDQIGEMMS